MTVWYGHSLKGILFGESLQLMFLIENNGRNKWEEATFLTLPKYWKVGSSFDLAQNQWFVREEGLENTFCSRLL